MGRPQIAGGAQDSRSTRSTGSRARGLRLADIAVQPLQQQLGGGAPDVFEAPAQRRDGRRMDGGEIGVADRQHRQVAGHRQAEVARRAQHARQDARSERNDRGRPLGPAQEGERAALCEVHRRCLDAKLGAGRIESLLGERRAEACDAFAAGSHVRIGRQQRDAPVAQSDQITGRRCRAGAVIDQDGRRADVVVAFQGIAIEDDDRRARRDEIAPHLSIGVAGRRHQHAVESSSL